MRQHLAPRRPVGKTATQVSFDLDGKIGQFCFSLFLQITKRKLDLTPYAAARAHDRIFEKLGGLVDERSEMLLHTQGAASAVNVARKRKQLARFEHGYALLASGGGRFLQIELCRHGNHEHIMLAASTDTYQGFEDPVLVLS